MLSVRGPAQPEVRDLHERPHELLQRLLHQAIAERLWTTEHTVEKHIKNILGELRLPSTPDDRRRVLAVLTYLDSR